MYNVFFSKIDIGVEYVKEKLKVSNDTKKDVYAIYDDGVLLYNRENKKLSYLVMLNYLTKKIVSRHYFFVFS